MSENRDEILLAIKDQGDLVRKLKAAKESKERVSKILENILPHSQHTNLLTY